MSLESSCSTGLAQVYAAQGRTEKAVESDLKYRLISGTKAAEIDELKSAFRDVRMERLPTQDP